jgi:hypothetical protein
MLIPYVPPDYFDLASRTIEEIVVVESPAKRTCRIVLRADPHIAFKGFKLSNNPRVNVCCDISFYPARTTAKYIPRLTFIKVDKEFHEKDQTGKEKVRIDLDDSTTAENFWKVIEFLFQFKHLVEIGDFEKAYAVVNANANAYLMEFDSKAQADKVKALIELLKKAHLSDVEIETVFRENREVSLKHFERLLNEKESWREYQATYRNEISGQGEEAVWHHFLKRYHWFLGLNIDIRFIRDLIPESDLGIRNTEGRGSPNADFLGVSDYTTLIELKTPKTKLFTATKQSTARTNTWSFSSDFIDGISQCLGQKCDWDKNSKSKNLIQGGEILDQNKVRTVDPKVIFIIGHKGEEFPAEDADVDVIVKRDTFERFRRNCRNVEILTFDELYERAYFILHNRKLTD